MDVDVMQNWNCKLKIMYFIILLLLIYSFGCQSEIICPSGWLLHGTSCYLLVSTGMTWNIAQNHCTTLNASLAEVTTNSEQEFLKNICETDGAWSYYIGGTDADKEGTWLWVGSGNLVTNFSWGPGEPNGGIDQNCIQLLSTVQYMGDDVSCAVYSFPFICEWEQEADVSTTPIATTLPQNNAFTTAEITTPKTNIVQQTTTVQLSEGHSTSLHTQVQQTTQRMEMTSLKTEIPFPCVETIFYSNGCCSKNETQEEIEQLILELRRYLAINKTNTNKHKRALISAPDHRRSAVAIGYCGVIVLVCVVLIIIAFDIMKVIRFFRKCCRNIF